EETGEVRMAGLGFMHARRQPGGDFFCVTAGQAHHANTTATWRGGDGNNGVVLVVHGRSRQVSGNANNALPAKATWYWNRSTVQRKKGPKPLFRLPALSGLGLDAAGNDPLLGNGQYVVG